MSRPPCGYNTGGCVACHNYLAGLGCELLLNVGTGNVYPRWQRVSDGKWLEPIAGKWVELRQKMVPKPYPGSCSPVQVNQQKNDRGSRRETTVPTFFPSRARPLWLVEPRRTCT